MKKFLLTTAALALLSTAAHAGEPTVLFSNNNWKTFYYAENGAGEPMCVMSAMWLWPNKIMGTAMVKWQPSLGLFMHISKSNWSIPTGESVPLSISFDRGMRDGSGLVMEDQKYGSTIQVNVNEDVVGFLEDFGNAKEMTVSFDSGTEKPWIITMVGSGKARAVFDKCVSYIRDNAPTQPGMQLSRPAPTQRMPDFGGI